MTDLQASESLATRFLRLGALGVLATLSLLLLPLPNRLLDQAPELKHLPTWCLHVLTMMNPLFMVIIAALLGATCAHRVSLSSLFASSSRQPFRLHGGAISVLAGGLMSIVLVVVDRAYMPHLAEHWQQILTAETSTPSSTRLAIGVLYGGIAEEIMLRWGLMSALMWAMIRVLKVTRLWAAVIAIMLSAVLFGVAHLPALSLQAALDTPIVVRTVLLNTLAGLVYGALYVRYHLEAAMLAHMSTHIGFFILGLIGLG